MASEYNYDDTIKYLKRYKNITAEIKQLENEIAHKNEMIDAISLVYDGMPRGTNISHRPENDAVNLTDKVIELTCLKIRAERERDAIRNTICQVEDATLKDIAYKKYIEQKNYREISVELHYSERWIMWKHKAAIYEICEILNKTVHYSSPLGVVK